MQVLSRTAEASFSSAQSLLFISWTWPQANPSNESRFQCAPSRARTLDVPRVPRVFARHWQITEAAQSVFPSAQQLRAAHSAPAGAHALPAHAARVRASGAPAREVYPARVIRGHPALVKPDQLMLFESVNGKRGSRCNTTLSASVIASIGAVELGGSAPTSHCEENTSTSIRLSVSANHHALNELSLSRSPDLHALGSPHPRLLCRTMFVREVSLLETAGGLLLQGQGHALGGHNRTRSQKRRAGRGGVGRWP